MADQAQPLFDDDGDQVGWFTHADDGALIGLDLEGQIVYAEGPDGEPLDPAGYQFDDEAGPEVDPRFAQLGERMDRVEESLAQPIDVQIPDLQAVRALEEADYERVEEDVGRQTERLERLLGRKLTMAEGKRVISEAFADVEAGDARPDLLRTAAELGDLGEGLHDLDTDHGRQAWMVERLEDGERAQAADRGEDDLMRDVPPPTQDEVDFDDDSSRQTWMRERLEGRYDQQEE
jgi:hypothetical protein